MPEVNSDGTVSVVEVTPVSESAPTVEVQPEVKIEPETETKQGEVVETEEEVGE
jgi:hypothetical protein